MTKRNDPCVCGSGKKYKKCCLKNDEPSFDDFKKARWSKVQSGLVKKLNEFSANYYGEDGINFAFEEFTLYEESEFDPDTPHLVVFMPWFFYEWQPDPEDVEGAGLPPAPPALSLCAIDKSLSLDEKNYLKACYKSSFSFYEVIDFELDKSITLKDILTDEELVVLEKNATHGIQPGDVLFGKAFEIDNIGVFEACAPIILRSEFKLDILNLKNFILKEFKKITHDVLHEYQLEILEYYHDFYEEMTNPRPPVLTNTDGDLMAPHIIEYEIESPNKTFESLHKLCFLETKEQMLEYAQLDNKQKVISIDFPWIKKVKQKSKQIILANITIENKKMTVEVNSKERVTKFKAKLKKIMPSGWRLIKVSKASPELYDVNQKSQHNTSKAFNSVATDDPELIAFQENYFKQHWKDWPNHPVPALNGMTPKEATKSKIGREMLDALISEFERKAQQKPMPGQTVETFKNLRKTLGIM